MRRLNARFGFALAFLTLSAGVASTGPAAAAPPEKTTYVVTFVPGTDARAEAARMRAQNFSVPFVYENVFAGMAVELPAAAAEALANNPNVASIEPDQVMTVDATQTSATWGLDRIDQASLPLGTSYVYPGSAGYGVTVFVIDTGIQANHVDFGGRVRPGYTAINDGRGTTDCDGHGTHVAGTVAGTTWGVAKNANLVPVRVLDCTGSGDASGVIAGMDWVAGTTTRPAVANMSLGGGFYAPINDAVANLVSRGVTVAVAAGNSNVDACTTSPASAPSAITVGATTSTDARASYSNFGTCVDIFAPGSSITSAWIGSTNTATATISGTSMASPHVAGVAAIIAAQNPSFTPAQVASQLIGAATPNKVTDPVTGSPNLLLYGNPTDVAGFPLTISTTSLPNATRTIAYSASLAAFGGDGNNYAWSTTDSRWATLGLTVNANGTVTGTPPSTATTGTYSLSVTVTSGGSSVSGNVAITVVAPPATPGTFSKSSPSNGTRVFSRTSATLSWAASTNATKYLVCISTTTTCTNWRDTGTSRSISFSGLTRNTRYYWQVKALNSVGVERIANSGTIWSFLTAL